MKRKIIILTVCVVALAMVTTFGLLEFGTIFNTFSQTEIQTTATPQIETFTDIGMNYIDPQLIQISPASFTPVITEDEAIATARGWLETDWHEPTDSNNQVATTVALVSGSDIWPPLHVWDKEPVWIVVIRDIPSHDLGGAMVIPPNTPTPRTPTKGQATIAIDAATGELLFGIY